MQTIGQLLKKERLRAKKSLTKISQETKIPIETLELIEADQFEKLPSSTFVKGFITSYAQSVFLSKKQALAVFRRDFTTSESGTIIPKGLANPLNKKSVINKNVPLIFSIILAIVFILGYGGWQLKTFLSPPDLVVSQPQDNSILKGPLVEVKGWVSADSRVLVNDQLAEVFPNGEFRINLSLLKGKNILHIRAEDRRGKFWEEKLTVEVVDK